MKYWQMYKTFLQKHLAYRFRVGIWVFVDVIKFFCLPFVWLAIYQGRTEINGYTQTGMITYYLIMIFISLVTTSHISRIIRTDIMNGDLNNMVVKPMNYCLYRFTHETSYKLLSGFMALLIFFVAFYFLPQYVVMPANFVRLVFFVVALVFSLLLSFAFQFIVGMVAFWWGENSGAERLEEVLELAFSGAIAPLVFYPKLLQAVANFLPFKFLSYFPAQVYLGQIDYLGYWQGLAQVALWLSFFYVIVWQMWKRGIKKYEGFGL